MIKGSQLVGRAVIDMEAAERLGKIKEIIVQRDGSAWLVLSLCMAKRLSDRGKAADDSRFRRAFDRA